MLSEAALAELLMTKPSTGPIFPRSVSLFADGELTPEYPWCRFFTGLLHEGIKVISIYIPVHSPEDILNFLEEAIWRSPNVLTVAVETTLMVLGGEAEVSLAASVSKMHKLAIFNIQSCLLTASIILALDQLPDLQEVRFHENSYLQGRTTNGTLPQSVSPNPFPRLTTLELQCSLRELCRYLPLANGILPGLRNLTVDVISKDHSVVLQNSLVKIAVAFPLLESFSIFWNEDYSMIEEGGDAIWVESHLTYLNLHPLTKMPRLREFNLAYNEIVSMTDNELCKLVTQCPSLQTLQLNPEPMHLLPTEITINVVPILAQACPQLKELHLFVNTSVEPA